jgi:Tfp pilus assembly protein PilF
MFPIDCYFDRATRFRPEDTVVRTLFGLYLGQVGRLPDAMKQFEAADYYAKDNAFTHNNIGLALFELKQYEAALHQAHLAAKLGFAPTLLADKLRSVNQWKDQPE